MRRSIIQCARAIVALNLSIFFGILLFLPARGVAQCSAGYTATSNTYTTTFTSSTQNASYSWSFPYFNPALGTLTSVSLNSQIKVNSNMSITNNTGTQQNVSAFLYRTDSWSTTDGSSNNQIDFGSSFTATNLANTATQNFVTKSVIGGETMNYTATSNLSGFQAGSGNNNLSYLSGDEVVTNPANNVAASMSIYSETIAFTVTYNYCAATLPIRLVSFTANREDQQSVLLAWSVADETAGQTYTVQVSTDGVNYTDYATVDSDPVNSNASYTYTYPISAGATGRLYFRLRMVDDHGLTGYSQVAIINLNSNAVTGFSIYPNPPSNFINLTLPGDNRQWQIDIISADGSLIQRNNYSNTSNPVVVFSRRLAQGTYFVRAINPLSGDKQSGSFLITQ
jgi:Secretion system C-terminal sorting domain